MSRTPVLSLTLVAVLAGPSVAQTGGGSKEPARPAGAQAVAPAAVHAFSPMGPIPFGVAPQAIAPGGGSVIIIIVPGHSGGATQPFAPPPMFAVPAVGAAAVQGRAAEADTLRNEIRELAETQRRLLQLLESHERRLTEMEQRVSPPPRIPAPSDKK